MSEVTSAYRGPSRRWRAVVWTLLAVLMTSAIVQYSLRYGRLAILPEWDDVGYMKYGVDRLNDLQTGGLSACVDGFLKSPPHSPYSSVVALVAFVVFGLHEWAPYAMSGLMVLVCLVWWDWIAAGCRFWVKLLLALFMCSIPTVSLLVSEFRPDMMWGLTMSIVAFLVMRQPLIGATVGRLLWIGVLSAAFILCKPTATPGSIGLIGILLGLATVKDWLLQRRWPIGQTVRAWAVVWVTTLVLIAPLYYFHWRHFDEYFRQAMFGPHANTWHLPGGWPAQFKYFLYGRGPDTQLAGHLYLFPLIWLAGWAVAIAKRDRQTMIVAAALLVFTIVNYAVPTLNPAKNVLLGSPYFGMVIGTTAMWLAYLATSLASRPRWVLAGMLVLVLLGAFLYRWTGIYYERDHAFRLQSRRLYGEIYDVLRRQHTGETQRVAITAVSPVTDMTLAWMASCDRAKFIFDRPFSDNPAMFQQAFERSDFALGQEDGVTGADSRTPNSRIQATLLAELRKRPDFKEIATFTADNGKKLVLFKKQR